MKQYETYKCNSCGCEVEVQKQEQMQNYLAVEMKWK